MILILNFNFFPSQHSITFQHLLAIISTCVTYLITKTSTFYFKRNKYLFIFLCLFIIWLVHHLLSHSLFKILSCNLFIAEISSPSVRITLFFFLLCISIHHFLLVFSLIFSARTLQLALLTFNVRMSVTLFELLISSLI